VAQAFQPAGSGGFPAARSNTGLESPVNRQTGMSAPHAKRRISFEIRLCFRRFLRALKFSGGR